MRYLLICLFFWMGETALAQAVPIQNSKHFPYLQGNEDYVKNPSCLVNVTNITASGGSLTRNTTTPLGRAGADCAIDASANGQTYDFLMDTKPTSLTGACLASFFYSGDATLYTAEVFDGSNTISPITTLLSVGSTGQRFEVGYSCTAGARVRIKSTSASAAAIKVVEVYGGRDYRLGTTSQPEIVMTATRITSNQAIASLSGTVLIYNSETLDKYSEMDTTTGIFTAKIARKVFVSAGAVFGSHIVERNTISIEKNGTGICFAASQIDGASQGSNPSCSFDVAIGDTIQATADSVSDTAYDFVLGAGAYFIIASFPSASEITLRGDVTDLVGEARTAGTASCSWSSTSGTALAAFPADTDCPTPALIGNAAAPSTKIPGITVPNLLPGKYLVQATGWFGGNPSSSGSQNCSFGLDDGTTTKPTVTTFQAATTYSDSTGEMSAIFEYTAAQSNITFQVYTGRQSGNAVCYADAGVATKDFAIRVIPLSQAVPAPFIPGSAFFGRSSVAKIGIATLNCDAASAILSNPDSMVSSIGNIGGGECAITLVTGYFTATPFCVLSQLDAAARLKNMAIIPSSATAIVIDSREGSTSGSATTVQDTAAFDTTIMCVGNN